MTLDFNAAGGDALLDMTSFDHRDRYPYTTRTTNPAISTSTMAPGRHPNAWIGLDMAAAAPGSQNTTSSNVSNVSSPGESPLSQRSHLHSHPHSQTQSPTQVNSSPLQHSPYQGAVTQPSPATLLTDWTLLQHQQQQQQHTHVQDLSQLIPEGALIPYAAYGPGFQTNIEYLPVATQAALESSLAMDQGFSNVSPIEGGRSMHQPWDGGMSMGNWQDFGTSLQFPSDGLPRFATSMGSQSPTGTYLEVLSLPGSSENGWSHVEMYQNYETYQQAQAQASAQNPAAIFNPSQTLHLRTNSDASHSDSNRQPVEFSSSLEEFHYSPFSPESDTYSDPANHRNCFHGETPHTHETISPAAVVAPVPIKAAANSARSSHASGSGVGSPPHNNAARRNSGPKKSPIAKSTKSVIRRTSNGKKDGTVEKKVGRRKGPLLPEQRKQASEIRKLRACLRCKFLKKTCDKGEPCGGCQPSHARLWQVPCTRIDIKDIGYFMKDWKADYERHLGRGVSVYNVKGFAQKETLMWITHGYGFCLPVMVREVYVADDSCFQVDWVESYQMDQEPIEFELKTERLDVGEGGINMEALAEYLDKHIESGFENFIDDHFEGTPFLTEIFKTAYRFYNKEKSPVIRKALKLVLAYNLTMHITLVEQQGSEQTMEGQIDDEDSKYYGKYVAPVMINFQIKCAMADMWRDLQKDILEELSALYSSVYSGDRLKNWPTIFMLACILLAVWEEMQFDCHYRVPDPVAVEKFCSDMESTPVGVITGLFHAISQKLPALIDWDTQRHGHVLNNNPAVCEAMTEVRQHVLKHESYLRSRHTSKFDRYDFDSLANKFLSKLIIKSN
ncbi:putative c6 finger domain-containing protein [Rosellinia necatrix]|uniref:Putative c6 finger domain-containing protein n=1 Tax=Rosellinia necatrix TaxID=77044 RepID=A0A1W2TG02_ROSNE|nr:putative c6 finger domain-containing protein [Rosellinia necatrix]